MFLAEELVFLPETVLSGVSDLNKGDWARTPEVRTSGGWLLGKGALLQKMSPSPSTSSFCS